MYRLDVLTPPAVEPVTLEEAKAWAKVDGGDEDARISQMIAAATASVELYLKRSLITRTLKLSINGVRSRSFDDLPAGVYDLPVNFFDGELSRVVDLPMPQAVAISSVTTYDTAGAGTPFAAPGYRLYDNRLLLNDGYYWPSNLRFAGAAEIVYTAGYGDAPASIPQPIRTAIMMCVAGMYDGCSDAIPAGAMQLLNQYRIMSL